MIQIVNFSKIEIVAGTRAEAEAKAPFRIMGDATKAYRLWRAKQRGIVTDSAVTQFMANYLIRKTKGMPGLGFIITVSPPGRRMRRKNKWVVNVPRRDGRVKFRREYRLVERGTGRIVHTCGPRVADAMRKAKEIINSGAATELDCFQVKVPEDDRPIFTADYARREEIGFGVFVAFGLKRT